MRERDYSDIEQRIRLAVETLRDSGTKVTKLSICEEAGLHRNTLNKPHYQAFLEKEFKEFCDEQKPHSYEELLAEVEGLRVEVAKKGARIRELNRTVDAERRKRIDFEEKYRFLLGEYQKRVSSKVIQF